MLSQLIILAVLIFLNAFFAASEIAFISLNDTKIEKQAKDGNKKAKQIEKMLKTPSKFLATIQIGITLAGFLSSAFASDTFAEKLAPILFQCMPFLSLGVWKSISIIIITIILSFFTLVFGELVPKRLAMKNYEKTGKDPERKNVHLIIGGAFQGKLQYAETLYSKICWYDGAECQPEQLEKELTKIDGIAHFELLVRRWMEDGRETEELTGLLMNRRKGLVVLISDEIGYGLVPVDAFERKYREAHGRLMTDLAAQAQRVDRVVCGIGTRLR